MLLSPDRNRNPYTVSDHISLHAPRDETLTHQAAISLLGNDT